MYDTHVHTTYSPDGKSPMEAYTALIDGGLLEGIGFAEHLDFMPECGAYRFLKYEEYRSEVRRWQEKGYRFQAGAEIDYNRHAEDEIREHLKKHPYDYTICSVHMVLGQSISDRTSVNHLADPETFRTMVELYYKELTASLRVPEFDVIGHPGIYKRYLESGFYEQHGFSAWISKLDHALAHACARSGKIIEVNTSGLFARSGSAIPGHEFLTLFRSYGGSRISVGSDAHEAAHAGRGIAETLAVLADLGFDRVYLPWDKENAVKIG